MDDFSQDDCVFVLDSRKLHIILLLVRSAVDLIVGEEFSLSRYVEDITCVLVALVGTCELLVG